MLCVPFNFLQSCWFVALCTWCCLLVLFSVLQLPKPPLKQVKEHHKISLVGQLPGCFCSKGDRVGKSMFNLPKDKDLDTNKAFHQIVCFVLHNFNVLFFSALDGSGVARLIFYFNVATLRCRGYILDVFRNLYILIITCVAENYFINVVLC